MMASSSAIDDAGRAAGLSGHEGSRGQRADSSAEIRSSSESCSRSSSRTVDRSESRVAGLGIGVPAGVAGLDVGERRLRHQRPQPHVLRFLLEEAELLLGDRELGADALQPFADVDEAALEEGLRHRRRI